ncbi:MAG: GntR family transcriptional regulator [Propioniciclava sp.]
MPQTLRIDLDRSSPTPLYHQVATAIEAAIDGGQLEPGEFLENEISLANRLNISRPTARQALQDLVDRGKLLRRRGVGTQVAPQPIRRPVELTSLNDTLDQEGRHPTTDVIAYTPTTADDEVATHLGIDPGAEVVYLERIRLADGEPIALLTNYLPATIAPSEADLAETGLYSLLRARGYIPKAAHQRIGARLATAAEARTLHINTRAALLTMERTAYSDDGTVLEFGRHIYPASRYEYEATLFAN